MRFNIWSLFHVEGNLIAGTGLDYLEHKNEGRNMEIFILTTIAGLWVSYTSFLRWKKYRDVRLAIIAVCCLLMSLISVYVIILLSMRS